MENKFDVIVIGGGLAGLTSAYVLAQNGFSVIVLEKAQQCGEKNVSGGILCGTSFQNVFDGIWTEAPIERCITRKVLSCVAHNAVVSYDYVNDADDGTYGVSLLRTRFDKWLAEKVEKAGAEIICGVTVDEIIVIDETVRGICVEGEKLFSDVVIIAEGANTLLTEKLGLRKKMDSCQVGVGIKEVIQLNETIINERFNVSSDQGAAIELFGTLTDQIEGGGFIYTNKESISLGLVFTLSSYSEKSRPPYEILETFKEIPYIKNLIRGGETVEYSAHIVPEMRNDTLQKIYGNGVLVVGDAAGFVLKNGRTVEGMNYAIESGKIAADCIIEAVQYDDYSASMLSRYETYLNNNSLFKRLAKFEKSYIFFQNPRLYKQYPELIAAFTKMMYTDQHTSCNTVMELITKAIKASDISMYRILKDAIQSRSLL